MKLRLLSFDIEDWFHILDNPKTQFPEQWQSFESRIDLGLDLILEMCRKHKIRGLFFCLGWVAEKYPELIVKIKSEGHLIGTHSYAHQLAYTQTRNQFKDDLERSIKILKSITGDEILYYRAPGFSVTRDNLWVFDVLVECGIKYDSSLFNSNRAHGGLKNQLFFEPFKLLTPSGDIIFELPIVPKKFRLGSLMFSGGGYFRILPIKILKKLFNSEPYIMTYFHPRDFDPEQPMVPGLGYFRKFKSYYGLKSANRKLQTILSITEFTTEIDDIVFKRTINLDSIV